MESWIPSPISINTETRVILTECTPCVTKYALINIIIRCFTLIYITYPPTVY